MKISGILKRTALFTVLLNTCVAFGQVQTDSAFVVNQIITGVDSSDVIIEGQVEEKIGYLNSSGSYVYTSNLIRVDRVWKDNSVETPVNIGDFIEIVTHGGRVNGFQVLVTHNAEFSLGTKGLFICDFNTLPSNPSGPLTNHTLMLHDGLYFEYDYSKYYVSTGYSSINFECIEYLYEMIDTTYLAECLDVNPNGVLQQLRYTDLINDGTNKASTAGFQSGNDIEYTFENAHTSTVGSTNYFEFDIYIEGNNSNTYFDNGLVRIQYNTQAFGSNIVANNKITVQRGAVTTNPVDYLLPVPGDISANEVAIPFNTNYMSSTVYRYNLTTTPVQVCHVKIQIADCSKLPTLDFVNVSAMANLSLYTNSATSTTLYTYDNCVATDNENSDLCEINISSFSLSLLQVFSFFLPLKP